jgi:hypothetical protein
MVDKAGDSEISDVKNLSLEAIKAFANYIHLGEVEKLEEHCKDLFILATQFGIDELKVCFSARIKLLFL